MSNTAGLSAATFPGQDAIDRSAAGLSYQSYQLSTRATGAALGRGRRVVPDPSAQFSSPPISGGQFGQGHAKSTAQFTSGPDEEY